MSDLDVLQGFRVKRGSRPFLWLAVGLLSLTRRLARRVSAGPRDRGDVPGWVLVTIMTAGLVVALWAIAGKRLGELFSNALDQVSGGPQ
jgi:hypothetical protein